MNQQENTTLKILTFVEYMGGRASHSFLNCHSIQDREIPLCKREDILRYVQSIWKLRKDSFGNSSNRTDYRHPICVGIPGVGKTRLLEEWNHIFDGLGIGQLEVDRMGLLVLYYNGHCVCDVDVQLPIEKTFAWRILHRYFFEGLSFKPFMHQLQSSSVYEDITIVQSILTVVSTRDLNPSRSTPLSFFLGIDEYQSITGDEADGSDKLDCLMIALYEATLALTQHGVHLYIMFAGTEWSPLRGTSSSRDLCSKVYIPFSRDYTPIAASLYPEGLQSETFQQCIFTIGNIPRNVVAFCREVRSEHQRLKRCPSANSLMALRNAVYNTNSSQWTSLLSGDAMITLAAFSLSGISVVPDSSPEIVVCGMNDRPLTWQQLADRGLVALVEDCDGCSRVILPYVALQQILTYEPPPHAPRHLTYFVQAFHHIHELTSQHLEPWQKWEQFGAYFHCLRINAYLWLGYEEISLKKLFYGDKSLHTSTQDIEVILRPAKIFFTNEKLSNDTNFDFIPEMYNSVRCVSLLSAEECFVVVNGTDGKGVDIYFMLKNATPDDAPIIFLDRRKRESQSLTTGLISKYFELMPCFPEKRVRVVKCLFSALASYGKCRVQRPSPQCVVLSKQELVGYHGSLSLHPCARCVIDPHSANKSQIVSILRPHMTDKDAKKLAKEIKIQCKYNFFRTFESLLESIQHIDTERTLNISLALKSQFYFVDEIEENEEHDASISSDDDNELEEQQKKRPRRG
mmetsp:Transcript_17739/g.26236  ORF Transcript_17739/g.26236 Transcript_17739/m.26236 type:complete len:741 (+) Transcript_17739:53-2275(+)